MAWLVIAVAQVWICTDPFHVRACVYTLTYMKPDCEMEVLDYTMICISSVFSLFHCRGKAHHGSEVVETMTEYVLT